MQLQYTHIMYPANFVPKEDKVLDLETIFRAVSNYVGINNLATKDQHKELAYARHLYCYIARKRTNAFLREIAVLIGKRHHTTVVHSCQTLKDWHDTDEKVRKDVENLLNILNK